MGTGLSFKIFKPKGRLSRYIQAIWFASINDQDPVHWHLNSDGCTGLIFNLGEAICLDNTVLTMGVSTLPLSTKTTHIMLPARCRLVGVRFNPAVSHPSVDITKRQPTQLNLSAKQNELYKNIFHTLLALSKPQVHLVAIYRWLSDSLAIICPPPNALAYTIQSINHKTALISQRQLERQFKQWLGITPKHFQRIIRVQKTLNTLKKKPFLSLAQVATMNGFADQSHMTKELKQIALITPKQYRSIICDYAKLPNQAQLNSHTDSNNQRFTSIGYSTDPEIAN
ncbi:hypothetical protein PA25_37500 [Pseudoalteromonas sp. A25]|uniref:helix-turn-helix domain-containing protein n=1 Tax=Pseudoalteromonas sp. A25 TaxID=116092 RepID=UPI001260452A|nr:helix-turn-helix domain-containing protein [Pseudoalteromonas sp. A25]BBN83765.1 hypothetical protein PA25_37500 [Pseudoalteromonas sp. A25]